ncbi:DUF438 domain-containing protein [Evansella sp. AB-P1]|uniref:DUF438 domain-containing protein n=1 Tax=Evansella sp. AB-P1 TaxID=3037653 RepID=UPI00241CC89C|nr:DUF438 domain-containing protein [Evansella sp. AB-P1]MDG5789854.1 DUF438 domain-containing protein [Evansella sp. AB-P1]
MSEVINNREKNKLESTERQKMLKEIMKELHDGKPVEAVKAKFEEAIGGISVSEISKMEQALMEEEGIPVSEVQRLCSVHTEVFKGSIEDIHGTDDKFRTEGHPVHTFMLENKEIDRMVNFTLALHLEQFKKEQTEEQLMKLQEDLTKLLTIDLHYSRKENLLFPYLEKYGIFGPTQVMWGVDDRIRDAIKNTVKMLKDESWTKDELISSIQYIIDEVSEMIFKEENILLPMSLEHLTEDEWLKIEREGDVIGYTFIDPPAPWKPERVPLKGDGAFLADGIIKMETGLLSVKQMELMMSHLPIDITYIDENDIVRFFSHGKDPIFHRTKSVIGRSVQNCHPPKSAHIVEDLLDDFKSGRKDTEDFWIQFKEKYVFIRYFAVRDEYGAYKGTLEMKQDIKPIQEITGEKRLMS